MAATRRRRESHEFHCRGSQARPFVHGGRDRRSQQKQRGFSPAQRFSRIPPPSLADRLAIYGFGDGRRQLDQRRDGGQQQQRVPLLPVLRRQPHFALKVKILHLLLLAVFWMLNTFGCELGRGLRLQLVSVSA